MSGTSRYIGARIEAHMMRLATNETAFTRQATVGEVAEVFGITKQTARKYLELLRGAGMLCRWVDHSRRGGRSHLYAWCADIPF
jgi:predicted transcriptional regulator